LELATGGFSQANFLAEGGFGSVHRGVLPDGQAVAVKQHKLASSQGDVEFCSEVEVLSCAQHRNVVMLIGFCIEDRRRLLVYEYICNGSLDSHLYGNFSLSLHEEFDACITEKHSIYGPNEVTFFCTVIDTFNLKLGLWMPILVAFF
jgi:serine/threonine protein kinase